MTKPDQTGHNKRDYDNYSGRDACRIREADKLRVDLAVWREQERQTILRRNNWNAVLRMLNYTGEGRKTRSSGQYGSRLSFGDLSRLDEHMESTENKVLALRIIRTQEEEKTYCKGNA